MTTILNWRDLSFEQRIALENVKRYGSYHRRESLAAASLLRAGLIETRPDAPTPGMAWRLTAAGERVFLSKPR